MNLVDPDEGNDLLFEVLAHPLSERVGPDDAVLSVLRDVTDLRRAANELERQVQRVRLAEMKSSSERDRLKERLRTQRSWSEQGVRKSKKAPRDNDKAQRDLGLDKRRACRLGGVPLDADRRYRL